MFRRNNTMGVSTMQYGGGAAPVRMDFMARVFADELRCDVPMLGIMMTMRTLMHNDVALAGAVNYVRFGRCLIVWISTHFIRVII